VRYIGYVWQRRTGVMQTHIRAHMLGRFSLLCGIQSFPLIRSHINTDVTGFLLNFALSDASWHFLLMLPLAWF